MDKILLQMILEHRINCLVRLGDYIKSNKTAWLKAKQEAFMQNGWFIPEFIQIAVKNIAENFLKKDALEEWIEKYLLPPGIRQAKTVGIVMAGNIPLVGFHDLLSVFMTGYKTMIKSSSKDEVLIKHLVNVLIAWDPEIGDWIRFSDTLRNCNAYIATGSNNTSRYFEYYFGKYPNIIRRNKTSVAVLRGNETMDELSKLADDVYQFFGLGCRNVTKVYVPNDYNFERMLKAFEKYNYLAEHHKYKNNYDYNLALHILNNKFYMTNGSLLLVEDASIFSPISQLNFEHYDQETSLLSSLQNNPDIQCLIGHDQLPFGQAQCPGLFDYADKTDTMAFLQSL
jgi:hypothetical protein